MALRDTILTSIHGNRVGLNHDGELVSLGGFAINEPGASSSYEAEFDDDGYLIAVPPIYIQAHSNVNHVPANTNETLVVIEDVIESSGITYNAGIFTVPRDGFYLILCGAQIGKASGGALRNLDLWVKLNNQNIDGFAVRGGLTNADTTVILLNAGKQLSEGDELSFWIEADDTSGSVGLYTFTGDTAPDIPSIIVTIRRT